MARSYLVSINLNKNELQNAAIQNLGTAPSSPVEGQIYYDSTAGDKKPYFWNGSVWVAMGGAASGVSSVAATSPLENTGTSSDPVIALKTGSGAGANGISNTHIASDAAIALSKLATDPLARANHTGTQLASTISDFDTAVRTSRLDQMAAPTASVSLNSQKITSLADPTNAQDAATKAYVDSVAAGLAPKDAVRAATTANVTLSTALENGDAIDGVTLATGDRILVKNQSTASENGIYTVNASGAPTRTTDADSSADLVGAAVFVSEGTLNGNTLWVMTTDAPITVGTTGLVWAQFGGPGTYTAGTGLSLTGSQFALSTPVTVANGGTGGGDAATARSNLGVGMKPLAFNVGDNSSTTITLTHNFGTRDVMVEVYQNSSPWNTVTCDVERPSTNTVDLKFTTAPGTNAYRAVITPAA